MTIGICTQYGKLPTAAWKGAGMICAAANMLAATTPRRPNFISTPFKNRKMRSLPQFRRKTFCCGCKANSRSSGKKTRQVIKIALRLNGSMGSSTRLSPYRHLRLGHFRSLCCETKGVNDKLGMEHLLVDRIKSKPVTPHDPG